jgi:glycosyltransferase involved in cell wall biosynthesis
LSLPSQLGAPQARNRGLARVATPFVLFLDDDDLLVPSGVDRLTDLLVRHPHAVAAIGRGVEFQENGDREDRLEPVRTTVASVFPEVLAGWCPQVGQAVLRTGAIRSVGGWTSHLEVCDDYDLWLRIAALGPVVLDPVLTVEVRMHAGQHGQYKDAEYKLCTAKGLSRLAARQAKAPLTTTRIHLAAWNRHLARQWEERGHRFAAAASYASALALAPELRRSVVMGPELRNGLRRALRNGLRRALRRG